MITLAKILSYQRWEGDGYMSNAKPVSERLRQRTHEPFSPVRAESCATPRLPSWVCPWAAQSKSRTTHAT